MIFLSAGPLTLLGRGGSSWCYSGVFTLGPINPLARMYILQLICRMVILSPQGEHTLLGRVKVQYINAARVRISVNRSVHCSVYHCPWLNPGLLTSGGLSASGLKRRMSASCANERWLGTTGISTVALLRFSCLHCRVQTILGTLYACSREYRVTRGARDECSAFALVSSIPALYMLEH